jgi:hypothetical protein
VEHHDNIQAKLAEMDDMIAQLDPSQRGALDEAVKRSPAYVKRFRLAFLRAEVFDAAKAAQRMAAHFALRLAYFEREDLLGRDIMLSDLSHEEIPLLQSGALQLLKYPDRAGRAILLICPGKYPYVPYHFPSLVGTLVPFSSSNAMVGRRDATEG